MALSTIPRRRGIFVSLLPLALTLEATTAPRRSAILPKKLSTKMRQPTAISPHAAAIQASRRLRQVDDSIGPVPAVTFTRPEVGYHARLVARVGAPNGAAEQDETTVILACAQHLSRVPRERCSVKRDEYQTGFGARDQQGRIVQAEPGSVLPSRNVNDGETSMQPLASGDESMRRILVSEQPRLCWFLRHARCGLLRGTLSRMPTLA
jgi:hypothetical protein